MANMSVQYRGPNPSLITLTNELRAHYGNPARTYEFVTGYKSPSNYSGHNPDSNGIVHAVDIFTDDHGNIPEAEGRALAERLRLVGAAGNRFSYLIHDQSAGAPQPMIAGIHNGWRWERYTGADPHSDHIHLSIADGYWGDPVNVPAAAYNDTSPWKVTGGNVLKPSGGNVTTIKPKEDTLSAAEVKEIKNYIHALAIGGYESGGKKHPGFAMVAEENQRRIGRIAKEVWGTTVRRGGGKVSALQELADAKTAAQTAVAHNAALKSALDQIAKGQGVTIDYAKIEAAAAAGVASAIADGVELDATVNIKNGVTK